MQAHGAKKDSKKGSLLAAAGIDPVQHRKEQLAKAAGKTIQEHQGPLEAVHRVQKFQMQGTKQIAKGILQNNTLEILNIKGNLFGDDGIILLSESVNSSSKLT